MISLSHGSVLDASPEDVLRAAASAGYDAAGLRLDPDAVGLRRVRTLQRLGDDLGLVLFDLEVVRLGPSSDVERQRRQLELAATLGVSFLLTVSEHTNQTDDAATIDDLGRLTDLACGVGVRIGLEFMRFTAIRSLDQAVQLVDGVTSAVVLDILHLDRSATTPSQLAAVPRSKIAYLQLCDAPARRPQDDEALAHEARHARVEPGNGELSISAWQEAVPADVPRTVEVQSDALQARLDPTPRAAHLLTQTRPYLCD